MNERKLINANDLRGAILAAIEGVLEGRISVPMANSVVGLSGELHKSIRQEWDMRVYANENLNLQAGKVVKLIGVDDED